MTRKTTSRTLLSALAVAMGTATFGVFPVTPAMAQAQPEPDIAPVASPVANQGPVVTVADATFPAGKDNSLTFTISDPENEGVQTAYWNPMPGFDLEYVDNDVWKLSIDKSVAAGEYSFEVQGEDIHGNLGQTVTAKITLKADAPAPQPTADPEPPTTQGPIVKVQGGTFDNRRAHTIPFTVDDPQGDHIQQVWWYPIPGATMRFVEENRWEINIAAGAKVGEHDLRLWAIDEHGNKGPETKVKVNIVDGKPKPSPDPNPGVNKGPTVLISGGTYDNRQRNVIRFKVVDPEGDWVGRVWWFPLPNSTLRNVEGSDWEIVMEPGVRPGDYPLRIWATDDKGNRGEEVNVTIRVVGHAVNAAPTINNGRIVMWAGYPYTYQVPVTDPDNDPVTLRIVKGEPWMSIVDGNKLRLAPGFGNRGRFSVILEASDGKSTSLATYDILVYKFTPGI